VDELLWGLGDCCYYIVGYANDIAILMNGKFPQTLSEVLQIVLGIVQMWCNKTHLSVSSSEIVRIPFTGRGVRENLRN
jgi:hypothetical protein